MDGPSLEPRAAILDEFDRIEVTGVNGGTYYRRDFPG